MGDKPRVNVADLQAVDDVIMWLADEIDDMGLEQCIEMRDALADLAKKIAMTSSLLETRAKKLLDGQPAKIGGKVYMEKATGKWRPDQARIRKVVAAKACTGPNGEELGPDAAAQRAVEACYDLFVAPSTMPKQGGMKKWGIDTKDVATWEKTGSELAVIATAGEDPA